MCCPARAARAAGLPNYRPPWMLTKPAGLLKESRRKGWNTATLLLSRPAGLLIRAQCLTLRQLMQSVFVKQHVRQASRDFFNWMLAACAQRWASAPS